MNHLSICFSCLVVIFMKALFLSVWLEAHTLWILCCLTLLKSVLQIKCMFTYFFFFFLKNIFRACVCWLGGCYKATVLLFTWAWIAPVLGGWSKRRLQRLAAQPEAAEAAAENWFHQEGNGQRTSREVNHFTSDYSVTHLPFWSFIPPPSCFSGGFCAWTCGGGGVQGILLWYLHTMSQWFSG